MKKFQSIGVLLSAITLLLVVLLVSVFTYSAGQAYARRESADRLLKTVDVLRHVYNAEDALRSEQGAMNTTLTNPLPANPRIVDLIQRSHADAVKAITAARDSSFAESGGRPNPNGARIRAAVALYTKRYAEALHASSLPGDQRPASMDQDWNDAVNGVSLTINLRTRERSMYIADSSSFNNEMTKIIRIAWAMRETAGR